VRPRGAGVDTIVIALLRCWFGALFAVLIVVVPPSAAEARALGRGQEQCFAVAPADMPPPDRAFRCSVQPSGYQDSALWLRFDLTPADSSSGAPVILVHQTRFDRLVVLFHYADRTVARQEIRRGDYASYWRIGGQVAFEAPLHGRPPTRVTLGLSHLASHKLLRIRVLPAASANRDLAIAAVLAGGSITLLLIAGIYNLSLAMAVHRPTLAWQGLWAVCMVLWGLFWSQIALIVLPGVAGTPAAQTCTLLACLAIAAATISVVSGLAQLLPRWLGRLAIGIGLLIVAIGLPASLVTGSSVDIFAPMLDALVLVDLAAVIAYLAWAWRHGDGEARDLVKAWSLQMAVLGLTQIFDFNDLFFGGGPQIAVLSASALQTVWLSVSTTLRLSGMRAELEEARATGSALAEIASRDPLTGLLNRRGFVGCLDETFRGGNDAPLALLLMDVDLFKAINDRFGHETGDDVLCRIAAFLRRLERELCIAGRMGGEEFVIAVSGLTSFALAQFAERVRTGLAACDHGEVSRQRAVTVSIGVSEGSTRTPFQKLYAAADRALYDAKNGGRNRVVFHSGAPDVQSRELERDQLSFGWRR
jgi:diguanylate cyclase (GGDEF)-like protein